MSTAIFPFEFFREAGGRYAESLEELDDFTRSRGGRTAVLARADSPMFRASGAIRVPQERGVNTLNASDMWDFRSDRSGRADTFLYLAVHAAHRLVDGGSLGTGDNSETAFAFSDGTSLHKFIAHGDFTFGVTSETDDNTLLVYLDGTLQTEGGGSDYTVSGNGTDPTVTFASAPGNNVAITVDYTYYQSVRFAETAMQPRTLVAKPFGDLDSQETAEFRVGLEEDRPGARYA